MDNVISDIFRSTILQDALKIFKANGVKAISMSDIAQKLGISPATLSAIAENKDDLFRKAILNDMAEGRKRSQEVIARSLGPVEQLMNLLKLSLEESKDLNPSYITDFMTFTDLLEVVDREIEDYSIPLYQSILNEGIRAGVFRMDINIDIVSKVIMQNLYVLLNLKVFPPERYNTGEVIRSIYLYYFRGLCEPEAARQVDNYFSK